MAAGFMDHGKDVDPEEMAKQALEMASRMADSALEVATGLIPKMAKMQRKYFDALVAQGFSPDQALRVMAASPLGKTGA